MSDEVGVAGGAVDQQDHCSETEGSPGDCSEILSVCTLPRPRQDFVAQVIHDDSG